MHFADSSPHCVSGAEIIFQQIKSFTQYVLELGLIIYGKKQQNSTSLNLSKIIKRGVVMTMSTCMLVRLYTPAHTRFCHF